MPYIYAHFYHECSNLMQVNWNRPAENWGFDTVATYTAGDIIDVEVMNIYIPHSPSHLSEVLSLTLTRTLICDVYILYLTRYGMQWCVSNAADHGGVYSYRICQDDSIVAKYLDPNYTPNESDWTAMEDCFQTGILKCSDVPGQNCAVHPDWYFYFKNLVSCPFFPSLAANCALHCVSFRLFSSHILVCSVLCWTVPCICAAVVAQDGAASPRPRSGLTVGLWTRAAACLPAQERRVTCMAGQVPF